MKTYAAQTFLEAIRIAVGLATRPQVADRWTDESACAGMTVGGLAHHLVGQAVNAVRLLDAPPTDEEPISLLGHYERAAWVGAAADDEANVGIREGADALAESGPAELLRLADTSLAALPEALAAPRDPDTVHIPWQGWSLSTRDFLHTRLMETVVHSDDLAVSIEVPTPEFPDDVVSPVLALLSALAVRRHGQAPVIRALSRAERAPRSIAAF